MMSSTLVETVSIDYEDFTESFLTCSTCLCSYDGHEHSPKLLHCSHTICKNCLERIVASVGIRDTGSFRCPICRETITLPRGGVGGLPPSFLVNQLLDLMSRQRREVVPKCSLHSNQELLFCETCDCVFCKQCTGGIHNNSGTRGSCEHTVIPFSIAIKRMSEILLYKAQECIGKLNKACDAVGHEMQKLDANVGRTFEMVDRSFEDLFDLIRRRKDEMMSLVGKTRDEKKKVLEEQMEIIQTEKSKVEAECDGLQYQVEVRNISKKISELNEKIDSVSSLVEPRENSYIRYESEHNDARNCVQTALSSFGCVHVSKTFPPLCTAFAHPATVNLQNKIVVTTVDYHGSYQAIGGDPVVAEIRSEDGSILDCNVTDNDDGTYGVHYTPGSATSYQMFVSIFDRPIKSSPLIVTASEHINPVLECGGFNQPVSIALSKDSNQVFVTDTGSSSIRVMYSDSLKFQHRISCAGLEDRSGTGIAVSPSNTVIVVNWRTRQITELTLDGSVVNQFTHESLMEPIDVAVNGRGEVIVADNGACAIFVFDAVGKLLSKIGSRKKGTKPGQFNGVMSSISTYNDFIVVADTRIQIFDQHTGNYVREIYPEGKNKGYYGGVTCDHHGNILATRSEKGRAYVQVFEFDGNLKFCIDSNEARLKRPSGIAVTSDYHALVVDLGNNMLKKYRYR
ncbi:Uncharacterised protein g5823 [Pycnogonum litorale]